MRKLFIVLLVLIAASFMGCSATFQPTGSCVDGESVILSVTNGNPTGLDKTLLAVNFAGLEKGVYTADQVNEFFDIVEDAISDNITYADLMSFMKAEVDRVRRYAGAGMIILGPDVSLIAGTGGPQLISDCDKQLILAHINHQRGIVALY